MNGGLASLATLKNKTINKNIAYVGIISSHGSGIQLRVKFYMYADLSFCKISAISDMTDMIS